MTAFVRRCHACQEDWTEPDPPASRDTCLRCGAALHVCANCRFYDPKTDDWCTEPAAYAERPRDPEIANRCEWFQMGLAPSAGGAGGGPRKTMDAASSAASEERRKLETIFGPPPKRDTKPPDWAK